MGPAVVGSPSPSFPADLNSTAFTAVAANSGFGGSVPFPANLALAQRQRQEDGVLLVVVGVAAAVPFS